MNLFDQMQFNMNKLHETLKINKQAIALYAYLKSIKNGGCVIVVVIVVV